MQAGDDAAADRVRGGGGAGVLPPSETLVYWPSIQTRVTLLPVGAGASPSNRQDLGNKGSHRQSTSSVVPLERVMTNWQQRSAAGYVWIAPQPVLERSCCGHLVRSLRQCFRRGVELGGDESLPSGVDGFG